MDITIMRHGETYWNKEARIQGSSNSDLTPFGIELAEITGKGFAEDGMVFDRIYTSPLSRAVQTAETVNSFQEKPASIIEDDRLCEMSFGKYEGVFLKEIKNTDQNIYNCFSTPSLYVADPTGESYEDVENRVRSFMKEVLLPLENEKGMDRVLVVCHGTIIRIFLKIIREMDLDELWTMKQPNCSVNNFDLTDGTFTVLEEKKVYYYSEEILNRGIL